MPAFRDSHVLRSTSLATLLLGTALVSGCAQDTRFGEYSVPRGNTVTDSQYQGQGASQYTVTHAPSQLQIDISRDKYINRDTNKPAPGVPGTDETPAPPLPAGGAQARMVPHADAGPASTANTSTDPAIQAFMPQAQTYMGTLPCFAGELQCQAQRVTLTLAPNGRWRARTTYLDGAQAQAATEQGCWNVTQARPARVTVLDAGGNARAQLLATQNNVLQVRSIMGQVPNMNYTLTRQPDLDPVSELDSQAAPSCL